MIRTYEAIISVLLAEQNHIDTEEIFIRLNGEKKTHSYAAVYSNVRKLTIIGLLDVQLRAGERRRYFALVPGWNQILDEKWNFH